MKTKRYEWNELPEDVLEVFNRYYSKAYFTREEWSEMERVMEGVVIVINKEPAGQGD